jgi:hypothetical protein
MVFNDEIPDGTLSRIAKSVAEYICLMMRRFSSCWEPYGCEAQNEKSGWRPTRKILLTRLNIEYRRNNGYLC